MKWDDSTTGQKMKSSLSNDVQAALANNDLEELKIENTEEAVDQELSATPSF